jgi:hypothetical protein
MDGSSGCCGPASAASAGCWGTPRSPARRHLAAPELAVRARLAAGPVPRRPLHLPARPPGWSSYPSTGRRTPRRSGRAVLSLDLQLDLRDNLERTLFHTGTYEPGLPRFLHDELRRGDLAVDVDAPSACTPSRWPAGSSSWTAAGCSPSSRRGIWCQAVGCRRPQPAWGDGGGQLQPRPDHHRRSLVGDWAAAINVELAYTRPTPPG